MKESGRQVLELQCRETMEIGTRHIRAVGGNYKEGPNSVSKNHISFRWKKRTQKLGSCNNLSLSIMLMQACNQGASRLGKAWAKPGKARRGLGEATPRTRNVLGRSIFARLLFLAFWGPKKGPFFVILFCSNFHSLEALKACLEACPVCFALISMVLRHWSSRLALRPASNFVSSYFFLVCCKFHNLEVLRLALRPSLCASCGLKF